MNKPDQNKTVKHSDPIAIHTAGFRRRSTSVSSSSSGSGSSPETPGVFPSSGQHVTIPSPSNSPILSYFLGQSPTKAPPNAATTYPFRKPLGTVPVFEEEPESQIVPVAAQARRTNAVVPGRLLQNPPLPDPHHERGKNLLRRLSLSTPMNRPNFTAQPANVPTSPVNNSVPPNTATTPTGPRIPSPRGKPSRSATISVDGRKHPRAPSPMGERILKGHFDSFH